MKKISILLVVLVCTLIPYYIFADDKNIHEKDSNSEIVKEDESKREENIKVYEKEDGTYQADIYEFPVHYKKNGSWIDIDNTLEEIDIDGETYLKNKSNDFCVYLSNEESNENLISLSKDKYSISWNLLGSNGYENINVENPSEDLSDSSEIPLTVVILFIELLFKLVSIEFILILINSSDPLYLSILSK
jgi:uncharacterized protein YxeA